MRNLKRLTAIVMAAVIMVSVMTAAAEGSAVSCKEQILYYFNSRRAEKANVVFFPGREDIPYISVSTAAEIIDKVAKKTGDPRLNIEVSSTTYAELQAKESIRLDVSVDAETTVYLLKRENGAFALFDADNDLLYISDRDLFGAASYALSGGDIISSNGIYSIDEQQNVKIDLFERADNRQFVCTGDVTVISLGDYDIHLEWMDGMIYLPVATFSDMLLRVRMIYNGEALFVIGGSLNDYTKNSEGETLFDLYYKPGARTRSKQLIAFNYNELCLMLDQWYGLAEAHGIRDGFDNYFRATEQKKNLCSSDINKYTEAMYELIYGYFGDFHSNFRLPSPYTGGDAVYEGNNRSISMYESDDREERFREAREAAGITSGGEIVDGYCEIGDTAFITFDSFDYASEDYYDEELWEDFGDIYMSDTISLVIWAQKQIHRENSPIQKVVIDLSCNGGGSLDACVYVAAWVLGQATVNIENVRTGARYSTNYWVDTNLDRKCEDDDDLGIDELDVYCLISGSSFSCGNYLPAMFKQDGRVTLVGQTSGGGSCIVHSTSTADGTLFNISDDRRLSIVKNGSFYDTDLGVEPDIPLRKCESYYDRKGLMEYLSTFR